MQVSFRKLALATALFLGLSSSLMANEDLLAMATNGAVSESASSSAEVVKLSSSEMKEVVGGYIMPSTVQYTYGSNYKQVSAQLSEGIYGGTAVMYKRIMEPTNGSATSYWINYTDKNGIITMAYSTQATALVNQYKTSFNTMLPR